MLFPMAGEDGEPLVEFRAQGADLLRVPGQALLPPAVGHRLEQRDQRRRRRPGSRASPRPASIRDGSFSSAAPKNCSPRQEQDHELRGGRELLPIRLPAPAPRCGPGSAGRGPPSSAAASRRPAPPPPPGRRRGGAFASTTMDLPDGSRTIRSGRSRPSSPCAVVCRVKSQYSSIPAISTTRWSWISPQRPRVCGARSAFTRFDASVRSFSLGPAPSSPNAAGAPRRRPTRVFSSSSIFPLELRQALPDRLHQFRDRELPLVQVALRRLLEFFEVRLGQFEEALVVRPERLGGESLERVGQLPPRVVQHRQLLLRRLPLLREERFQPGLLREEAAFLVEGRLQLPAQARQLLLQLRDPQLPVLEPLVEDLGTVRDGPSAALEEEHRHDARAEPGGEDHDPEERRKSRHFIQYNLRSGGERNPCVGNAFR